MLKGLQRIVKVLKDLTKSLKRYSDVFKEQLDKLVGIEKRDFDTILMLIDSVVIQRNETTVRSTTWSSGDEPRSVVQNSDQLNFPVNADDTPLSTVSGHRDWKHKS